MYMMVIMDVEEMAEMVCKVIFQDELMVCGSANTPVDDFYVDGMTAFFYNFDLPNDVVKAALVCKKWNQTYKDWLQRFFEKEDMKLRETAVVNGLAMCGLARYDVDDVLDIEQHTQELHTVMVHFGREVEMIMITLHLTRWKADDAEEHTLTVEYWPKAQVACARPVWHDYFRQRHGPYVDIICNMPARVTQIPQVCFEAPAELMLAQREEIEKWKQDFAESTALWLPTQRDAEGQEVAIEAWRRDFGAWKKAWSKAQASKAQASDDSDESE